MDRLSLLWHKRHSAITFKITWIIFYSKHNDCQNWPQTNPCAGWLRLCKASTAAGFTRDMGCHTDLFFFPPRTRAWLGLAGRHHSLLNLVRDELLEWRHLFFSCLKSFDSSVSHNRPDDFIGISSMKTFFLFLPLIH